MNAIEAAVYEILLYATLLTYIEGVLILSVMGLRRYFDSERFKRWNADRKEKRRRKLIRIERERMRRAEVAALKFCNRDI